jgi:predicted nucleic acid-binding protein
MSVYVVDASVGIKWFVPEVATADALRLQASKHELHVPAFFEIEVANIVWKKLQRAELSKVDADDILSQIGPLPLIRHSDSVLIAPAFDLAARTSRTVYDCMYLALAVQLGGILVTADERFVNSLSGTQWQPSIVRVQDVP